MAKEKTNSENKWANHFFDFFMLFLAVSLGFLVDNFRDNINSDKLAKEMASDLRVDLRNDSMAINDMILHCEHKMLRLDSLYSLVDDDVSEYNDTLIYKYTAYINKRPWFERHGSTIYLLINSGYLSNFTKEASMSITSYDLDCVKLLTFLQAEKDVLNRKIFPFLQDIFHIENLESLVESGSFVQKPELRNWDRDKQWTYHNYITELKILNEHILNQYRHLAGHAAKTLRLLREQY